jgi:hypothetical protein
MPDSSEARLPAEKARTLNRSRWNIGCSTRVSMKQNTRSMTIPPPISAITLGLVHPIVW